jgi:hypothetical protein
MMRTMRRMFGPELVTPLARPPRQRQDHESVPVALASSMSWGWSWAGWRQTRYGRRPSERESPLKTANRHALFMRGDRG